MKKKIFLSILILTAILAVGGGALAQTLNPVVLTWRANDFYPADYEGKALPIFGTPITVSAEALKNNKLIDLSQANFLWYVDENLASRGAGLKQITFNNSKGAGDYHFVRVDIQSGNDSWENSLRIYSQGPTVIIESPAPNQAVPNGSQILLRAVPYFFNVVSLNNLSFSWLINGQKQDAGSDNQLLLTLGDSRGQNSVALQAAAQNQNNPLEVATNKINLTTY